jgi:hypothetical protein
MTDSNEQVRQALNTLWERNFLNLRAATQQARARNRTRLDIGFELIGTAFNDAGDFHDHARDCLRYLSASPHCNLFIWTYARPDVANRFSTMMLLPNLITVKGINENKISISIDRDPRKPYFDVLLDPLAGFDAKQGHWFWAQHLFGIAEETLRTQMSGLTVIRSREQFAINPPTSVFRSKPL